MSRSSPRRLLVAVHDVTPAHARRLERLYRLLEERALRRYALLVVPNWHGEWPLEAYPEFAAQLHERAAGPAEIVLHGWRHDEFGLSRPLRHRLRTFWRTAREAEFAALQGPEAAARIALGVTALRAARLEPIGFVPPAWLWGLAISPVVRDAGLRFVEDQWCVWAVASGRRIRAPAICWSTRRAYLAFGSVAVAAARLRIERSLPLVRIALHPHDVDSPTVLDSCRRTLDTLLEQRGVIGYDELLPAPVAAA